MNENNKSKNYYEENIKKLDDNIDNIIEGDIKEQFKFIKEYLQKCNNINYQLSINNNSNNKEKNYQLLICDILNG